MVKILTSKEEEKRLERIGRLLHIIKMLFSAVEI